jgi:uncharacterized repeat protein (TIGR03803 family)
LTIKIPSQETDCPGLSHSNPAVRKTRTAISLAFVATFLTILATGVPVQAQTFTDKIIYSFSGGADGNEPLFSGVVQDEAGNFYGTTYSGGAFKYGTVFKVDAAGNETVLHSFGEKHDGRSPIAGLVIDPVGHLFGTTSAGGIRSGKCEQGCGIVFEIEPNGDEKILHGFAAGSDGAGPFGGLIRDQAGNLYGTTELGGAFGCGTIFKVDASGAYTILYSFAGQPDAQNPEAGLIRDDAGNFYGTTADGGVYNYGSVYKLDASGHETVLHSFAGGLESDGQTPVAALFRAPNGDLYGTTYLGGTIGIGTVFKLDPDGNETILHTFGNAKNDGAYAESPLVSDSQGNLYSTTIQGGTFGLPGGIVFEISAQGEYSIVYDFGAQSDGSSPDGPLLPGPNGSFFGTTSSGGAAGPGTVYELIP